MRFPLTADIYFNAEAKVESAPGQVYRSLQPLNYRTTNAYSISPFQGEVLILQNNVDFVDSNQVIQFTIEAGSSSITLGPDLPSDG